MGEPPQGRVVYLQGSRGVRGGLLEAAELGSSVLKAGDDGRVGRVRGVGRVELGALSYTTCG